MLERGIVLRGQAAAITPNLAEQSGFLVICKVFYIKLTVILRQLDSIRKGFGVIVCLEAADSRIKP